MGDETVEVDMRALLAEPALAQGPLADRYRLGTPLGQGGSAIVVSAEDTLLERPVAVKLLRDIASTGSARKRFVDEARLLAGLSHPGIVTVLDAGFAGARPFLVMERVDGTTLADLVDRDDGESPDRAELAGVAAAVAEALSYAHVQGVVHRDVKPGNVLVRHDGTVKLADFGIARVVGEAMHHTSTGMLVGTVAYLAPEQVSGDELTTAVDVYALGLVLIEALSGGTPVFPGSSVESALARLHRAPTMPDDLPRPWRELLTAMTARRPADRPTAAEVAGRLARVDSVTYVEPLRRSWLRRLLVPGVAAGLVLALAAGLWLARGDDPAASVPAALGASGGHPGHSVAGPVDQAAAPVVPAMAPAVVPPATQAAPAPRHHRARHHRRHHRHHARHHHRHQHHRARHHHKP